MPDPSRAARLPMLLAGAGAALALCWVVAPDPAQAQSREWVIVHQPRDGQARTVSQSVHLSLESCEREIAAQKAVDEKRRREVLARTPPLSREAWQALNTRSEEVSTAVCVRR